MEIPEINQQREGNPLWRQKMNIGEMKAKETNARVVEIPRHGFLRLKQVLLLIPISKSAWWAGVKNGRFPASIKLSARTTVWSAEDIFNLVEQHRAAQAA